MEWFGPRLTRLVRIPNVSLDVVENETMSIIVLSLT